MLKELFLCKDYLVSDEGYVLGKNGHKLKPSLNHKGYEIINVMVNGKRVGLAVHTAVMMSFCGNSKLDETYQVNHIDGNKRNNCLENLEWVTPSQNIQHSIDVLGNNVGANNGNAKSVIGTNVKNGNNIIFSTLIEAGAYFYPQCPRYGQNNIYRALSGLRKTAYGYKWKYYNAKLMEQQTCGT